MINLIPPGAQKQVKREYWIRVLSVWMLLGATAFLIVTLLFAPVYLLVQSQQANFSAALNEANDETQAFKRSEDAITQANEISELLTASNEKAAFTEIIIELESLMGNEISITDFSITKEEKKIKLITIMGIANSRLSLTDFKNTLEKSPLFAEATLPISNLAKDRDIPFTIQITPKETASE